MYLTKFKVRGSGQFPLDMLRYDGCYPLGPSDVEMISLTREDGLDYHKVREVGLVQPTPYKGSALTPHCWASFGWSIVRVDPPIKVEV